MMGKLIALIQIPNQRLFGMKAAAQYLGMHEQTLRQYADEGVIPARRIRDRRAFLLDDLNGFIEGLPRWDSPTDGE